MLNFSNSKNKVYPDPKKDKSFFEKINLINNTISQNKLIGYFYITLAQHSQ